MRASPLLLAALALALAACASEPAKKTARKPAATPPAKTAPTRAAQARPAEPKPAPVRTPATPAPTTPAPATNPAPTPPPASAEPARATDATPRAPEPVPGAASRAAATPQERYAEALELLRTGQLQAAEAALVRATKDFPQQTGPQTNLGIVLARLNRKADAATAFGRAVALDPRNAIAHNWLGVLARERGDHRAAEQAYRQALAADATYAPAQLNLAILYDLYFKRPAEAVAAYRRYEEMTGRKDVRAAVWIAELQAQLAADAPKAVPVGAPKAPAPATKGTKS